MSFAAGVDREAAMGRILSPLRFVRCQRLPDIRLGNSELSRNPCWRDARLEGGANGIHLTTGQRYFGDVRVSPVGGLICRR